jgi:hypothetical protein
VRQLALQNLLYLCQVQNHKGYTFIVKAATNFARRMCKSPFTELVCSLSTKWELESRLTSLMLINAMIIKCPNEKKLASFLARLENIGLYDELRILSNIKDNPKLKQ